MITVLTEMGHFLLVLGLALSVIQTVLLPLGLRRRDMALINAARGAAIMSFLQIALAFAALITAFIRSDFSVALVASHSHSLKPLLYKISGTWGNHEGSLLLWVLILSLFGAMLAARLTEKRPTLIVSGYALAIQGAMTAAFIGLILSVSNPFLRLNAPPIDGQGLNPVLQDPALAFHPPMLYLGYVGLSLGFAFAVAALIEGQAGALWARAVRPWLLVAWSALTCGIALGSWWAYYELGWGGWWFWDPVENASLMPWLIATALIHSLNVVEKRGLFQRWTILLAIAGFALSLIGTFIVRSGLLVSVHAFTNDPTRGVAILAVIILAVGLPLLLYGLRGSEIRDNASGDYPALVSRETALQINNLLLVVSASTVFIGTMYPLGAELIAGEKISVGAPFYESTVAPILGIMVLMMGIAPLLAWKSARISRLRMPLLGMALTGGAVMIISSTITDKVMMVAIATIGLAVWLLAGLAVEVVRILRSNIWMNLPRWGMVLAHFGVVVFMLGVAGATFFESEKIARVNVGDEMTVGAYRLTLSEVNTISGANYTSLAARLTLDKGKVEHDMLAEIRYYPAPSGRTTEAAIQSGFFGDAYVVFGGGSDAEGYVLRFYHKPLVSWIWWGVGLMALGGLTAMAGHRRDGDKR